MNYTDDFDRSEIKCIFCHASMEEIVSGKYSVHWCRSCGVLRQRYNFLGQIKDSWRQPLSSFKKEEKK